MGSLNNGTAVVFDDEGEDGFVVLKVEYVGVQCVRVFVSNGEMGL